MFKGKKSRISRSEHAESNWNIKTELIWIYWNIKKNIIQLNFSGFGLAPLLTSRRPSLWWKMTDYHRLITECWVVSVTRRVLLRAAESAGPGCCTLYSLILLLNCLNFLASQIFHAQNPRWQEHSIFPGLFSLCFFCKPFLSDYGMFGQGFILIYFISNFGQANNVDWNPVNATSSIFQVCFCSSPSFHLSHLIMVCLDRFLFWSS
jgi:hypothetical protein